MPDVPRVSLLIPTHNNALTIAETINACTNQTVRDLEIVVYDEASKDDTEKIVEMAAARDSRIRFFHSDSNSGPVRAWRRLLHEARGKWATFVWSDDLIVPQFLEKMLAVLEQNPSHLAVGCNAYAETILPDARNPDGTLATTARQKLFDYKTIRLRGDEYSLCVLAGYFPVTPLCSLFSAQAAREAFDDYIEIPNPYGFDFSRRAYGNDFVFLSEITLRAGEIILLEDALAVCRSSPSSLTANALRDHLWQYRLQYVWAMRQAWMHCRDLSPHMETLIRVADDRANFCDVIYSWGKKVWPHHFNAWKITRALEFLMRHDRRTKITRQPQLIQKWLSQRA